MTQFPNCRSLQWTGKGRRLLKKAKLVPAETFKDAERAQLSMLAAAEKKALIWLARRMPAWPHRIAAVAVHRQYRAFLPAGGRAVGASVPALRRRRGRRHCRARWVYYMVATAIANGVVSLLGKSGPDAALCRRHGVQSLPGEWYGESPSVRYLISPFASGLSSVKKNGGEPFTLPGYNAGRSVPAKQVAAFPILIQCLKIGSPTRLALVSKLLAVRRKGEA